jgi:hypothetical protein
MVLPPSSDENRSFLNLVQQMQLISLDQRPNAEGSIVELPLNTPPVKGFPNVQFQCT